MLHYWPDMRKIKKSQKSKIEKKNRCVFRFLGITFLFRKMVNRDRNQNAPFWEGFRTMYRKYMFSKNLFWDKNLVKSGMDLVRKLKNGMSKSKTEKRFRKMKKNRWKIKKISFNYHKIWLRYKRAKKIPFILDHPLYPTDWSISIRFF